MYILCKYFVHCTDTDDQTEHMKLPVYVLDNVQALLRDVCIRRFPLSTLAIFVELQYDYA